jgi:hypothetical protein
VVNHEEASGAWIDKGWATRDVTKAISRKTLNPHGSTRPPRLFQRSRKANHAVPIGRVVLHLSSAFIEQADAPVWSVFSDFVSTLLVGVNRLLLTEIENLSLQRRREENKAE